LLPAGANRRVGLAPTGKRRLVTAHTQRRPLSPDKKTDRFFSLFDAKNRARGLRRPDR
jgi:hypothetical protein